jgi:hypothetical protein
MRRQRVGAHRTTGVGAGCRSGAATAGMRGERRRDSSLLQGSPPRRGWAGRGTRRRWAARAGRRDERRVWVAEESVSVSGLSPCGFMEGGDESRKLAWCGLQPLRLHQLILWRGPPGWNLLLCIYTPGYCTKSLCRVEKRTIVHVLGCMARSSRHALFYFFSIEKSV